MGFFTRQEPSSDYRYQDDDINTLSYSIYCYNYATGRPAACRFEYEYLGYDESHLSEVDIASACEYGGNGLPSSTSCGGGGHSHSNSRPATFNGSAVRLLNAEDEDASDYGVKGVQPTGLADSVYQIVLDTPEASGLYSWRFNVRLPPGFAFTSPSGEDGVSLDGAERNILGTNIIEVKNLVQFPAHENYLKVRSPDDRHVDQDAYQVEAAMHSSLTAFAHEYRLLSGSSDYRISFNDISLPLGGLFDINGGWTRPHGSHRRGRDADLNKTPDNAEAGYVAPACEQDYLLHRAAQIALLPLGARPSPILCESGNRRHIDYSPIRTAS